MKTQKTISDGNKLASMLNLKKCKEMIKNCAKDETVILIPHYSINKPEYSNEQYINGYDQDDFFELEDYFNCCLIVSDYDDLIADPYGIYIS